MKIYKLTDKDGRTWGGMQWGENVTHEAVGKGKDLCSNGWIHGYEDPLIAVFMNPIHGAFDPKTMLLWECEGSGKVKRDGQLKLGVKACTTLKVTPVPKLSINQRIAAAIYCAQTQPQPEAWTRWANAWLDGSDRSRAAARAASEARAAAWEAAARAATASAWEAAAWAADAARAAEAAERDFDLLAILQRAYQFERVPA